MASIAFINTSVWSGTPGCTLQQALAIKGNKVLAIGTTEHVRSHITATTRVVDCGGIGLVVPGLCDTHVHLLDAGRRISRLSLRGVKSKEEFIAKVACAAASTPLGKWILGSDWNHFDFGHEWPRAEWLDAAAPDHPVLLVRCDAHSAVVNTAAMRAAGIDKDTPNPENGEIVRDVDGTATGVLRERAMELVKELVPRSTREDLERYLAAASGVLLEQGVTSVHTMCSLDESSMEEVDFFLSMQREGKLATRVYSGVTLKEVPTLAEYIKVRNVEQSPDDFVRVGLIKGFLDGSLGSCTAAMLQPYVGTENCGTLMMTHDQLLAYAKEVEAHGFQLAVHAIGDKANRVLVSVLEECPTLRRPRVEHAQHIHPDDVPRFGKVGAVAAMQPSHLAGDGVYAHTIMPSQSFSTTPYPWKTLRATGTTVVLGSDWFVTPPHALYGVYCAVTRRDEEGVTGRDGWIPSERLSIEEALRGYTVDASYAWYREGELGRLEPGYLADVAFLSHNVLGVDVQERPEILLETYVAMTVVNGEVKYERTLK